MTKVQIRQSGVGTPFLREGLIAVTLLLCVLIGLKVNSGFIWSSFLALLIFSVAGLLLALKLPDEQARSMVHILLLGYAIRVVFAFATIGLRGGGDEIGFDRLASMVRQAWLTGNLGKIAPNRTWYPEVNGLIYLVFGDSFLAGRLFNCLIGLLIVWATYRLAEQITQGKIVARYAGLLTSFMPGMIFISAVQRKDALIILLTVVGISRILRLSETPASIREWIELGFVLLLLSALRVVAGLSIAVLAIGWLVFSYVRRARLIVALFLALVAYLLWTRFAASYFTWALDYYVITAERRAAFGSEAIIFNFIGRGSSLSAFGIVDQFVLLVRFLVSPHPFYLLKRINVTLLLDALDGIFWYGIVIPFAPIGLYRNWHNKHLWPLLLYTIALFLALSTPFLTFTQGTFRQRLPAVPFILIFTALGIKEYRRSPLSQKQKYRWWFLISVLLTGSVGGLYMMGLV